MATTITKHEELIDLGAGITLSLMVTITTVPYDGSEWRVEKDDWAVFVDEVEHQPATLAGTWLGSWITSQLADNPEDPFGIVGQAWDRQQERRAEEAP